MIESLQHRRGSDSPRLPRSRRAESLAVLLVGAAVVLLLPARAGAQLPEPAAPPEPAPESVTRPPEPAAPDAAAQSSVTPPKLLRFVDAPYPKAAEAAGITADLILHLRVEADGSVSDVEIAEPAGHGFDEAAASAARQFVFAPALVDGQPVAVKIPFKYSFTLSERAVEEPVALATGELSGRVQIAGADGPLAGARVTLSDASSEVASTVTAADGSWAVRDLSPGSYRVRVEAPGFIRVELDEEVNAGEATELTYRLAPDVGDAIVVSIFGARPPREVVKRTITRRQMTRVPGTGGDALRSLQNLPGVARPPGLAGLLIVRGSAPQDSAVFVDGDTVPFIYHFGGVSSAVPTELLERIDFYPGNFSARYGRVMGGIVDVGLRAPDMSCSGDYGQPSPETGCFHGLAQLDLIDTRALVQGPLPIKGWSFALGGRRSWVDTWLKPVLEATGAGVSTAPVYYDFQAIATGPLSPRAQLSLRFFGSDDALEILIENPSGQDPGAVGGNLSLGTRFWRVQSVLDAELARGVELSSLVSVGNDHAGISLGRFRFFIDSYPIQLRNEFSFRLLDELTLHTGLDFQVVPSEVLARLPEPPRPGEPAPGPFTTRPLLENAVKDVFFRPAWYADAKLDVGRLELVPGLRIDHARDTGHSDLSPRLTARYHLTRRVENPDGSIARRTTLKAGAGLFHQPPTPQETDRVFGTPGLVSNRAYHYALGIERELTDELEVSVEGFYKALDRLISRSAGLDGTFAYDNEGDGYAVGAELLLEYKEDDRFFGWLAYTLSRSVRQNRPDEDEYLFQFDQTHILTALGSYRLGNGWEVGARFRLISGPLDTPVRSAPDLPAIFAADAAAYTPLSAVPFSERLPLVHQLDLRVEKAWQLRDFKLTFFVDLWNAYNNAPREGFAYNFDYSRRTYQQGLPIIPSLGFKGEF